MREPIATKDAPAAVGPYSQGIRAGGWVFVSGQIPLEPATGRIVEGGIEQQTRQALDNVRGVLEAGGTGLEGVVRVTVYLVDLKEFEAMNRVYAGFFPDPPPTRACVEVSGLPRGARVEIDAIALAGS